jgi:hypothetical protein
VTRLRIIAILTGLLLAAGLVAFSSQAAFGTNNDQMNQVEDWCEDGMKVEPVSTPYVVPAPPAGATWTLLVLKAGTDNQTIANPVVGQAYSPSNGKDISHVILCYEREVPPSTTTTTTEPPPTTTTTEPPVTTTTLTVPPSSTTTTTEPPITTTTSTTQPPVTSTTVPPDPTTTTSEVPPPTLIESGDAGYIDALEEEHDDEGFDWLFFGVASVFALGVGVLAYFVMKRMRDRA